VWRKHVWRRHRWRKHGGPEHEGPKHGPRQHGPRQHGPRQHGRHGRGRNGERGSSAIELAILAPALIFLTLIVVQFAIWFQSRGVALAAAQAGARVARDEAGVPGLNWAGDAQQRASQYYNALGTRILGPGISAVAVGSPVTNVGVRVTGQVSSIIPGLTLTITESSEGPVECFRPENAGGAC
jgi:Flp pilus assembly protein TadG